MNQNSRNICASDLVAQFLQTVDDCKALTSTRKVLAPIPAARREVDPSELQRLDDYFDRMADLIMRAPRRPHDYTKPDSTQGNTERNRRPVPYKIKPRPVKVVSTMPVTVTQENERVTPSGPSE
ncbi:hypothetical protein B5X24_HaOG207122 [Helicoverpa armigera]|uniref:Uncharacterized protein n=1 Tax=Helicoverpa armigera TaxID=29058 RepID=A0A2W1BJ25_HELAM|nr:hypothetical protein B5X24_HaOG207122 [Helicoverpa armigera]